jgi:hypothetical protein
VTWTPVRHYKSWTMRELSVACDRRLTAVQASRQLGRTTQAIYEIRRRHNAGQLGYVRENDMAIHWCICSICGTSFCSLNAAQTDCGANDETHIRARMRT